eukprot:NODE_2753_length_404_cov_323.261972_g2671_i0.p1 GENE.NODE_2753_length_404_cov_323.261972_g2671_i0~~NODE_2753_length_404_cov_323.261972_g2671_i0.p1  ORF type:complete len:104 (-),score=22.28 NODE_2753_length_404_cov_323.261972_g2671_i0:91-381(-)
MGHFLSVYFFFGMPAAPAFVVGFGYYPNGYLPGSGKDKTLEECMKLCADKPECGEFSYRFSDKVCHLKPGVGQNGSFKPHAGHVSGRKPTAGVEGM